MWKWILIAAVALILLLILWPILFPASNTSASSVISPVPNAYGNAYGFIDTGGTQVTAVGASAVEYTPTVGTGIMDELILPQPMMITGKA